MKEAILLIPKEQILEQIKPTILSGLAEQFAKLGQPNIKFTNVKWTKKGLNIYYIDCAKSSTEQDENSS